jgi:nucleoside 2-deoxyribosyltransferase
MKIYISGALLAASDLGVAKSLYESFGTTCRQAGHRPYVPHTKNDPARLDEAKPKSVYESDAKMLLKSDLVVAYLGEPSLGVGAEIAMAIHNKISIIALYEDIRTVSRFLIGLLEGYDQAIIYRYKDAEDANLWLINELRKRKKTL